MVGLFVDGYPLFGLNRLVEAVAPVAVGHAAAGAFVDDDDLFLLDHVMLVALEAVVSLEGLLDGIVELVHGLGMFAPWGFGIADQLPARLVQFELLLLGIEGEMLLVLHLAGQSIGPVIDDAFVGCGRAGFTRNDQRGTGLVDEDIVSLVDQSEVMAALNAWVVHAFGIAAPCPSGPKRLAAALLAISGTLQSVAQKIETELACGTVGDVHTVSGFSFWLGHLLLENTYTEAQQFEKRIEPFFVALGQVVVNGGDMNPFARKPVQAAR